MKETLRRQMLSKRNALSEEEKHDASLKLADVFFSHPELQDPASKNSCIAAYFPIKGEISPLPLLKKLEAPFCLPVLSPTLTIEGCASWSPSAELVPGPLGTKQPNVPYSLCTPTLIFLPMLAFSARGVRLGYGQGCYDKWIATHKTKLLLIGLAYSFQEVPSLPEEAHDQRVDFIITPERCFRCKQV